MKRIKRVAVLGAGVMGSGIAAHLANAGLEVLLLDTIPRVLDERQSARGLTLQSPEVRSSLAALGLQKALEARPSPFFLREYARQIEVGNLEDDIGRIRECDWVLEAVVENLQVKKNLLTGKVVPHLAPGAILSTNTSGLSVNAMAEVLPEAVRRNFLVTHFFNPPRYMRLMEIVGCRQTDPEILRVMGEFLSRRLGKGVVFAKDTPNFIANRIGLYSLFASMRHMTEMGMSVEEVDAVAGPATARPKSAVFRTADLVGIDTLVHVGKNSYELLQGDEERDVFRIPEFLSRMVGEGLLGAKTRKGFYRKEKDADGASKIHYYDYAHGEYLPSARPRFPSVEGAKRIDDPADRLRAVLGGTDKGAEFAWKTLRDTLIYSIRRIPEIADDIVSVDEAMRWGFNWEIGPFEMLDAVGVRAFIERARRDGVETPRSLQEVETFYRFEGGKKLFFDLLSRQYREIAVPAGRLRLDIIKRAGAVVQKGNEASIVDLGEGVFCLEFHSRMNTIGSETLAMTHRAIERAEAEGVGLVIANQGSTFCAGANLTIVSGAISRGDFDGIDRAVRAFQSATMALKYSRVPVVVAPFGMTLGGGCEFALHADAVAAHAETYMGLVEVGVGLLPAGGGTKEMCLRGVRLAQSYDTDVSPFIFKHFRQIATAKVSTSAAELFGMGYLRRGDEVTMDADALLADARAKVLALSRTYRPEAPQEMIPAPGRGVAASIRSQLWNMVRGGFATEYEATMGALIAGIICGGDVPAGTPVTEEYLLDLEREGFLSLCGNRETAQRIEHMLKTGKPLRN